VPAGTSFQFNSGEAPSPGAAPGAAWLNIKGMMPPSGKAGEDIDIMDGAAGACAKAKEILSKTRNEVRIFFIIFIILTKIGIRWWLRNFSQKNY
jgi:hypothetical protein